MKESIFPRSKPPVIEGLSVQDVDQMIRFTRPAFGTSNWNTKAEARPMPYYFNLDKAMGSSDAKESGVFLDNFARHISSVIQHPFFRKTLGDQEPVLGYVCSMGAPSGIVQLRSALSQRLDMASVLIFPEKRLL